MTDTATTDLNLTRDTLTLVTLSGDYYGTPEAHVVGFMQPHDTPESRTFYATISRDMGDSWGVLVVPETDPRCAGMWGLDTEVGPYANLRLSGPHYGWNVERRYLTPVEDSTPRPFAVGDRVRLLTTEGSSDDVAVGDLGTVVGVELDAYTPRDTLVRVRYDRDGHESIRCAYRYERVEEEPVTRPRPASADMTEEDRRALPIEEAYPVGSVWDHVSYRGVVVSGHPLLVSGAYGVRVDFEDPSGTLNHDWTRGALDTYGTFVGWAEGATTTPVEASQEPTTAPVTFSQEDVDRLVREARQAEHEAARQALEEFKEMANARAVQYAEDNGLCSEFEACMEDIGLMGREEWKEAHATPYSVRFIVTVRDVMATDSDDAIEKAREDLYNELPENMDRDIAYHSVSE